MSTKSTGAGLGISNITAVVPTSGKRDLEILKVKASLEAFGFEDIIINEGTDGLAGRFDAMDRAKNDIIYTQDDDLIVNNIQELIDNYEPGVIVANAKMERVNFYQEKCGGKIALIGYGSIFDRDLRDNMLEYFHRFENDDLTKREMDRIFTWVNKKKLITADITEFMVCMKGLSNEPEHPDILDTIINRLRKL